MPAWRERAASGGGGSVRASPAPPSIAGGRAPAGRERAATRSRGRAVTAAGRALRELFDDALVRVAPAGPVAAALRDLDLGASCVVLAVGKAALGMAAGAEEALAGRIRQRVVVVPEGAGGPPHPAAMVAAHPTPDGSSEAAGRALLAAAASARPLDDVVALISGGGSALAAVPAMGLSLADKVAALSALMNSGAPIGELNTVRRQLSDIKGGRLARASVARVTTLVVSDVVGDDLSTIASGPTIPDRTTAADAYQILERWIGWDGAPASVRRHLTAARLAERRAEPLPPRLDDRAFLVLGLDALVGAALAAAAARDIASERLAPWIEGDVGEVAGRLLAAVADGEGERLWIAGGEPTVSLPARPGRGGRAHQLALLIARAIRGREGLTVLCAGSDGIDGNSGAAGAVVDGDSWDALAQRGVDGERALATCDAAGALAAIGASIETGPTGVNHADLVLLHRA